MRGFALSTWPIYSAASLSSIFLLLPVFRVYENGGERMVAEYFRMTRARSVL